MAEALYRKYRPQVFEDVVGQEPIERTLKNAISQDKVSHAYLFCGPRGTGKTTTARLLAKALLCQKGPTPDPDGSCEDCNLIADGAHPDVYELDAASRTGVENVREEIISRVQFAPTRGRYKVYIIDEVHMLSTPAFNALLKTLEEPPSHVVFILCTTDPQKVPETIHSRCQRFDFRRIAPEGIVSRLGAICMAEEVEFEGEALDLIAQRAEGGLRNALTSLEQIIAFENGKVTLAGAERLLGSIDSNEMAEIMAFIGTRDIANCFRWTSAYVETGADLAQFVRDMAEHVRNLYVMALEGDEVELDITETARRELAGELQWFGPDRASRLMCVLGDLSAELKTTSNQRLAFEIALTRMVRPDSDLTLESLAERVEALESGYSAVAHVLPGQPAVASANQADAVSDGGAPWAATGIDAGAPAGAEAPAAASNDQTVGASAPMPGAHSEYGAMSRAEAAQPQEQANAQQRGQLSGQGAAQAAPASAQAEGQAAGMPSSGADSAAPETGGALGVAAEQEQAGAAPAASQANRQHSSLANPASLQRIWKAVLGTVKKEKQAYGVLFLGTKVEFDEASATVKVLFPEENGFAFTAVQKPDVTELVARSLQKAVGQEVPFAFERMGSAASGGARNAAADAVRTQGAPVQQTQARAQQQQPVQQAQPLQQPARQEQPRQQPQPQSQEQFQRDGQAADGLQQGYSGRSQASAQAHSSEQASYEQVPYDEVPYGDMPYDAVPYEEFDDVASPEWESAPTAHADNEPAAPAAEGSGFQQSSAASEEEQDLQAMLQAGFGGGVVLEEVEE